MIRITDRIMEARISRSLEIVNGSGDTPLPSYGGEITPEEIRARISEADAVYIRVDQNKANWVKGDENGSIDLW